LRPERLFASLVLIGLTCLAGGGTAAQPPAFDLVLTRYASGQFDQAIAELAPLRNLEGLLDWLRDQGPAWIAAAGESQRARRELAAASFALEAARTRAWDEWKWIQRQPAMGVPGIEGSYQPPDLLYWRTPPLVIEWACGIMRARTDRLEPADATPVDEKPAGTPARANSSSARSVERWWQLAALSVAQRSEDFQFLVGNPFDRDPLGRELGNPKAEIEHLNHVLPRFKDEPRFTLAQGIAVEWRWGPQAIPVFDALKDDIAVGAEARMRAGAVFLRAGKREIALKLFHEVESLTRDPYVIFLARFFTARALEAERKFSEAEAAYRAAAATVPNAQSASTTLAAVLYRTDRRSEAQRMVGDMLRAQPPPADPWRTYLHADDRFWPQLISRVRAAILR
jgi:tetratricopeptide (TPR) repeat protein